MDLVGFEPTTSAHQLLFQALLFIPYLKGADMEREDNRPNPTRSILFNVELCVVITIIIQTSTITHTDLANQL